MEQKPVLAGLRKPAQQEILTYIRQKRANYLAWLGALGTILLIAAPVIVPDFLFGGFSISGGITALGGLAASVWGMGAFVLFGFKKGYIGEASPLDRFEAGCYEVVRLTVYAKKEKLFPDPEFILVGEEGVEYICISERTYRNAYIGDMLYGVRIPDGLCFVPRQLTLMADEMLSIKRIEETVTALHGIQDIPDNMPGLCLPGKISLAKEPPPPKVILSKEYRPKVSLKKEDT